ncbi:hypothetical protein [Effusibacillus pohliae]|uniref:hypothetical protein n=1 Tax=Effusibacillus pohliae TaxID=232270 RepID=UPI000A07A34C|nr:hypothetical protein [Effusibacillus pohliae]
MGRDPQELYPEAMLNLGIPSEMSPIEDLTGATNDPPMLEITRPLEAGEPAEIRRPLSLGDLAEHRQERL